MRRYIAVGALGAALAYFFDRERGRRRRGKRRDRVLAAQPAAREGSPAVPPHAAANAHEGRRRPPQAAVFEAPPGEEAQEDRGDSPRDHNEGAATVTRAYGPIHEHERLAEAGVTAGSPLAEVTVLHTRTPRPTVDYAESPVLPPPLPTWVLEERHITEPTGGRGRLLEPGVAGPRDLDRSAEPAAAQRDVERTADSVPLRRRWIVAAGLAAAAFAVAAVGLAAWAVSLSSSSDNQRRAASEARALARDRARGLAVLSGPKSKRITLTGAKGRLVLVVAPSGQAVLIVSGLDRAPAGKSYEAWVLSGKTPEPAGLFAGGPELVLPLSRPVPRGAQVAVTLEPARGADWPTSKPLFVARRV